MALETISELRVRYAETDQMGVVYHANYLVWCEIGRTDFIRAAGKSYADLEREGVRLAVSDVTMRFHASARYDDRIVVHTTLTSIGSRGMTFGYRVERVNPGEGLSGGPGTVLVRATTSLVCTNEQGRLATLPPDVRRWLEDASRADGRDAPCATEN